MSDIGARAMACKGWRWMAGMAWRYKGMLPASQSPRLLYRGDTVAPDAFPDLTDPATLGCVEHLMREAWQGWAVTVRDTGATTEVTVQWRGQVSHRFESNDRATAIVRAWEAAGPAAS